MQIPKLRFCTVAEDQTSSALEAGRMALSDRTNWSAVVAPALGNVRAASTAARSRDPQSGSSLAIGRPRERLTAPAKCEYISGRPRRERHDPSKQVRCAASKAVPRLVCLCAGFRPYTGRADSVLERLRDPRVNEVQRRQANVCGGGRS